MVFSLIWSLIYYVGLIRLSLFVIACIRSIIRQSTGTCYDLINRYGTDSWVFVTGGGAGIGLSFCKSFAKRGFNLIILDYNAKALEEATAEIKSINHMVQVKTICRDLFERNEISFYQEIVDEFADLDVSVIVNNAGIGALPFNIASLKEISNVIKIHNIAQVSFVSLMIEKMRARKQRSAIINMASIASNYPMSFVLTYSCCKAFVRFFTMGLFEEQKDKIDVICASPAFVSTSMTDFKKGIDTCSPEVCVENILRDLGKEPETYTYWFHELVFNGIIGGVWQMNADFFFKMLKEQTKADLDKIMKKNEAMLKEKSKVD